MESWPFLKSCGQLCFSISTSANRFFALYDGSARDTARILKQFNGGDGIVSNNVEDTVKSIGMLAKDGMQITDKVILDIMLHN